MSPQDEQKFHALLVRWNKLKLKSVFTTGEFREASAIYTELVQLLRKDHVDLEKRLKIVEMIAPLLVQKAPIPEESAAAE